jgi:hypothetical protein
MFAYQMVSKEINELFDIMTLARSASYEAMLHASANKDELCKTKMGDLEQQLREASRKMKELQQKMEFLKDQP